MLFINGPQARASFSRQPAVNSRKVIRKFLPPVFGLTFVALSFLENFEALQLWWPFQSQLRHLKRSSEELEPIITFPITQTSLMNVVL